MLLALGVQKNPTNECRLPPTAILAYLDSDIRLPTHLSIDDGLVAPEEPETSAAWKVSPTFVMQSLVERHTLLKAMLSAAELVLDELG